MSILGQFIPLSLSVWPCVIFKFSSGLWQLYLGYEQWPRGWANIFRGYKVNLGDEDSGPGNSGPNVTLIYNFI